MQVNVLKPGLLTTIQDQGRIGYRDTGIPVAGAMDKFASQIANILVGNKKELPVLELTYGDVVLKTATDVLISCCGDGSSLITGGRELPYWKSLFIPANTELRFKTGKTGCRTYISIAGGWCAQHILNSHSTYLPINIGGFNGAALQPGDKLQSEEHVSVISLSILSKLSSSNINYPNWGVFPNSFVNYTSKQVRVIPQHEFDWFDNDSRKSFFEEFFTLTMQSNRMGYQLDGQPLTQKETKQLLSIAVSMGTIQITSSGSPILLMADCQTTGGYPRIAQVAAVDLPVCAQLKPGDTIQFKKITLEEAEREYLLLLSNITA
ncbi:MAG TPA: biotin-dependent carboxyltransferase family protein, partial [Flavitalea sp.]|nr:biotin-dependent carboxyltransferase family protein [Flavitalea sp.]